MNRVARRRGAREASRPFVFTSESVAEGHPDKVCDWIADSVLDAYLARDPSARVAIEVMVKLGRVFLAGEVTSGARVDLRPVVRGAVRELGYTDPREPFHAEGVRISSLVTHQSPEIGRGVDAGGAGDQGIMFGYATDETPELMPLPILLAHRLGRTLAEHRRAGTVDWLGPDAKTQVSVRYQDGRPAEVTDVLVSTQHAPEVGPDQVRGFVASVIVPEALVGWAAPGLRLLVNPAGTFVRGGPSVDAGVTGRKIIVDTYGGMGRHGGGAFSGKDPTKVDRSGAYFCRFVARQIVKAGLARRAEVQVAYAIGVPRPVAVKVDTFGTGHAGAAEEFVQANFDFRPAAILERLDLRRPIYRQTTHYGHFGKPHLSWEG